MRTMRISTSGRAAIRPAAPVERRVPATVRLGILVVGIGSLIVSHPARAADPPATTPDAELLEFLGSGDDGDPELQKYLVKQDDARPDDAKATPKRGDGKT